MREMIPVKGKNMCELYKTLQESIERWKNGEKSPRCAFSLLATIGALRRQPLEKKTLFSLREIENVLREDIASVVNSYGAFVKESGFDEEAGRLDEEAFLRQRDEHQMAFEIFREYVEEEGHPTPVLASAREYLFVVDNAVVWNRKKVEAIRRAALRRSVPPALDTDIFWWWRKPEENCWVPFGIRNLWIAAHSDGLASQGTLKKFEKKFQQHLRNCSSCQEECAMLKEWCAADPVSDSETTVPKVGKIISLFERAHRQTPMAAAGVQDGLTGKEWKELVQSSPLSFTIREGNKKTRYAVWVDFVDDPPFLHLSFYASGKPLARERMRIEIGKQRWEAEKGVCNIPARELESLSEMAFVLGSKKEKRFYFKECEADGPQE